MGKRLDTKAFIERAINIHANEYDYSYNGFTDGISDHTVDFGLWNKHHPKIIEWHYKLLDSTGLDARDFARTPEQLSEIL